MLGHATTTSGVFTPGTTKRATKNMYDAEAPMFVAQPDGPFETIRGPAEAQAHFKDSREIKLKGRHGIKLPPTSYRDHYPPKSVSTTDTDKGDLTSSMPMPFAARSEYHDQYDGRPGTGRVVDPMTSQHSPLPWLLAETTNQAFFRVPPAVPSRTSLSRPATTASSCRPAPAVPWQTTNQAEYTAKTAPRANPDLGTGEQRHYPPWMGGATTYNDHYIPKQISLARVPGTTVDMFPFEGCTEYKGEYTPKDVLALDASVQLPPLTGTRGPSGAQLRLPAGPRQDLGVQFWHAGDPDRAYVLIPRTTPVPITARVMMTTVHDDQAEACILIVYGGSATASLNQVVGQFQLVGIPPAAAGVPRFELRFHLDGECRLRVEARDMDTQRHKLWMQRGEVVALQG